MPWAALAIAAGAQAVKASDLTTLSLEQLLDIRVVGATKYEQAQDEVAAAVSIITRNEIRAFGWRTLGEALGSLPGVFTTYDRQYVYLGARGLGLPGDLTARILITINGNRVNDPVYDGGPAGRDFPLDMDLVERIEFIPGPGGAVYGQNAMFGVVNVVTRSGADLDGAELAAGYQGPQHLREGRFTWGRKLDNGVDMLLSASGMRMKGEDRLYGFGATGVAGVAKGLDGERDHKLLARLARDGWSFDLVHGDRHKGDPTGSFLSDPLVTGQYVRDTYTLAQLQYRERLADDAVEVSARLFGGAYRFGSVLSYGTPVSFPTRADWVGTEWRMVYGGWAGHKLMLGVEAQHNARTDQAALDLAVPENDVRIPLSGSRVGVYMQDEWRISEVLSATVGVRLDRASRSDLRTSPRVALIWQAAPSTTLKALAGRAHRAPNAYESQYDDQYSVIRNPELKGERIDTLELVLDHRVSRDLALRGSIYRWAMRDIVALGSDPDSGLAQYQSGERLRARGIELSADKTWRGGARARGSVSVQDVSFAGGSGVPNAPGVLARFNLSAPLPWYGLRVGYEWRFDAGRRTLDGTRLGGYGLSNLHIGGGQPARGLAWSISVRNLFDKRHAHPGSETNWQNALDQDGRAVRVQLTHRF